jgi:hypothetical protein
MLNGLTDPSKKKLVQVYIVPKAVDKSQRKRNQISVNTIHNYRWQDFPIAICRDLSRLPDRVARWFLFQTKNPNAGIFRRTLEWEMLIYIVWSFGIFYEHWVYFIGNLVIL